MLKDNLKTLRKNKGLSQEELSVKLNVVDKQYQNGNKDYLFQMQKC